MEQQANHYEWGLSPDQFFTLLYLDADSKHSREKKKKQLSAMFDNFYYIGHDSSFLPFLTVKENMLLGVSKKEIPHYQHQLKEWSHFFKLKDSISQLKPEAISTETNILIHLVRAFALERPLVLIDDTSLDLSQLFMDSLIPTLIHVSRAQQISVIFVTNRMALVEKYSQQALIINDQSPL